MSLDKAYRARVARHWFIHPWWALFLVAFSAQSVSASSARITGKTGKSAHVDGVYIDYEWMAPTSNTNPYPVKYRERRRVLVCQESDTGNILELPFSEMQSISQIDVKSDFGRLRAPAELVLIDGQSHLVYLKPQPSEALISRLRREPVPTGSISDFKSIIRGQEVRPGGENIRFELPLEAVASVEFEMPESAPSGTMPSIEAKLGEMEKELDTLRDRVRDLEEKIQEMERRLGN